MGVGLDTTRPDQRPALPWAAGDLMLTLYLEGDGFLTLRVRVGGWLLGWFDVGCLWRG